MGVGRDIAYAAGALVSAPVWGTAMLRTGKWRTDWAGRLGRVGNTGIEVPEPGRRRVLIHAVSVGEVNLVRNLVAMCEREAPEVEVVIAVTTNTGIARAQQVFSPRHRVVRYPLDFSWAVGRFLDAVRPDVVALAELEVWPNFIDACVERGVSVCVINGRLSARSFRNYRKARPLLRSTFAKLSAVAAQTEAYAERFRYMGVAPERVRVLDTMKWDTAVIADTVEGADELAAEMGIDRSRPVVVAGSTAPGEEELLLRHAVSRVPAGTQVVIAPRKPEWFDLVEKAFPGVVRRTRTRNTPAEAGVPGRDLFLLDTIGELRKAYALADLVIVGRSFGKLYGSDMMEPIALGKPTIVGPRYSDFQDTVEALLAGGGIEVVQPQDLPATVARLLTDRSHASELARKGRDVILSRQGSTRRHFEMLLGLLNHERGTSGTLRVAR